MTPEQNNLSPEEMLMRMQMLRYKVHEKKIAEVWTDLENAGFEPLLIKGWAAAQFYPQPYQREFSDIDISIKPQDFDEAESFLRENSRGYNVDLHRGLRRHDTLPFEEIYASSCLIECDTAKIRVPCREDHLRILCVHWLTDGGAYRERLWDIFHGINSRPADFDWDRFLVSVSSNRRRWIVCTIGLAHKYLKLPIEDTPISAEAKEIPDWLIRSVESEWQSDVRLQPLPGIQYKKSQGFWKNIGQAVKGNLRNNPKVFWGQVQKRLASNPIAATVDVEGSFDGNRRFFYRIKSFIRRLEKFGRMKDV